MPRDPLQREEKIGLQKKQAPIERGIQDLPLQKKKGPTAEVGDYLKMISRLENNLQQNKLSGEELEQTITALGDKLGSFNKSQLMRATKLDFFQKRGGTELESMQESLAKVFRHEESRLEGFELLKSQDFMSLLLNKPPSLNTYSNVSTQGNRSRLATA
ncbi:MAG: hypothetical protein COB67_03920 [SAR324 cluster bacterium]|uniref:Uncharacterized protein n=1 Tax=SAR324 cluster bacterium TaxID=2024889 RepID=A0A2A4T811_9DELT|nr:MAG: hypothetical protein COB67_03920 [SAR324 cluster bacterium]